MLTFTKLSTLMGDPVIPPLQDKDEWDQMKMSIAMSVRSQERKLVAVRSISRNITEKIRLIETGLNVLCQSVCVNCSDVCCTRATLWYDFKDLLYIFLSSGMFPRQQIGKKNDLSCSCLTTSGCRLKRYERPFICTWYTCPRQKELMRGERASDDMAHIDQILQEIKYNRKQLEKLFIETVC